MIGIIGGGQVGQHLAEAASKMGVKYDLIGRQTKRDLTRFANENVNFDVSSCKASDLKELAERYDAIIYTSSLRDVMQCEKDYALADKLNHLVPRILAQSRPLVYISTDYVFGKLDHSHPRPVTGKIGEGEDPESAHFSNGPKSVYGKTKRNGELATLTNYGFVVRIASPFGDWASSLRPSFVSNMRFQEGEITIPRDQIVSPTYLPEVAPAIVGLSLSSVGAGNVYHAVCEGEASYADIARQIRRELNISGKVIGRVSNESDALRPTYSALQNNRLQKFSHWAVALQNHFERGRYK